MNTATAIKIAFPVGVKAADLTAKHNEKSYLWIDWETGKVNFHTKHQSEWGNITFHQYHGHSSQFEVSGDSVRSLRAWFNESIAPLVAEVVAGYSSEWDGSNNKARFTEDAYAALEEIRCRFETRREDRLYA